MTAYKYQALSSDGAKVSGVIEAYDEFEAVAIIKQDCDIVLDIKPVRQRSGGIVSLNDPLWVSAKSLSMAASQFSILLKAGLPTARAAEIIAAQTTDRLMRRILKEVAADVAAGYSLAASLEARGKKIPVAFIETVRAGEESGTLEQSFDKLAKYYDKTHKLRSKVRGAMMYPALLCVLAVGVVALLVTVTIPVVAGIIEDYGGELPLPTRMLLAIADFFGKWWLAVLGAILLIIIVCMIYKKTETGRLQFAKIAMHLPVMGKISILNSASQFANTMSTLLTAGLSIPRALTITGKVIDNYAVGLSVGKCTAQVEEGKRLGETLGDNPYLPELLTEMTAVGEESGSLEDTLDTIGEYYDSEVEQASSRALSMMEPAITIIMGIIVAFIVVALYLPMFTMYSGM